MYIHMDPEAAEHRPKRLDKFFKKWYTVSRTVRSALLNSIYSSWFLLSSRELLSPEK